MRAINHAMTGALIGLTITTPVIAMPLAIISHFVCDMIPHYDLDTPVEEMGSGRLFKGLLLADGLLCFLLVVFLAVTQPVHWQLAAVCAFLAAAPDLLWIPRYIAVIRKKPWKAGRFSKFAENIQWFAKPIGGVVEVVWFFAMAALIAPFISP